MSIINKIKELINNFKSNTKLRAELEQKEKECEELHARTASIIHRLTGGRLTYSTYTLEGCEDAYTDQLRIDVERATKELQEENGELKAENFAFENLVITQEKLIDNYTHELEEIKKYLGISDKTIMQRLEELQERRDELSEENEELKKQLDKYKQALEECQDQEPTIVNTIGNLQLQVKAWIEQSAKYKQALDEIKNYQQRNCETCVFANAQKCNINCQVFVILDIINKAKGMSNGESCVV